eukprot:364487-Chlamydomonas_euryale.AAC.15
MSAEGIRVLQLLRAPCWGWGGSSSSDRTGPPEREACRPRALRKTHQQRGSRAATANGGVQPAADRTGSTGRKSGESAMELGLTNELANGASKPVEPQPDLGVRASCCP